MNGESNVRDCSGCRGSGCAIDQVITGGESGPKSRPYDLAWARSLIRQCRAAGVAVFHKQVGSNPFDSEGPIVEGVRITEFGTVDRKGGDPSEWPSDLRIRELPTVEA